MELLITDGETFFHEDKRDLKYTFEYIDADALGIRMHGHDPQRRYSLTKEIITDPHYPVVLMRVRLRIGDHGSADFLASLKVYVMLAPRIDGRGMGNSARVVDVAGKPSLLAWQDSAPEGTTVAMIANSGFLRASCGYVGTSDGWQDLHRGFKMDWQFGSALNGNVSMMGQIPPGQTSDFRIALGFGDGHHAAIAAAMGALATPFERHQDRFIDQWQRVESPRHLAEVSGDYGRLMQISHNLILAHEDKTFAGAFIASASIPWGYAKGDDDLGGSHLVWTRDMGHSASALLASGQRETALRALVYLACTQQPDGGFAQNFWVNGTPYWTGLQLDEVAFPIILAWRLWKVEALEGFDVFSFVERAAMFLLLHAPVTQQERWEENAGYSPSTLAAVITSLICAAEMLREHGATEFALLLQQHADWIESHLEDWTVTNDGVLHPAVKRHYMRIRPPECGAPYVQEDCGKEVLRLNNRPPGSRIEFEAREIIDAGFLELVRYGVRRADDPLILDSIKVVDSTLRVETPHGPCWRRYNHDGYGTASDGSPFTGWGQGRAWPLLTGERAHYELSAGNEVRPYLQAMEAFASEGGMLPEQVWDGPDTTLQGEPLRCGDPAGSAMPLIWAHAEYLTLLRSVHDKRVFDRIDVVAERYSGPHKHSAEVEIFLLKRAIREMRAGCKLRIIADRSFRVIWTSNNWKTSQAIEGYQLGNHVSYADLPVQDLRDATVSFTLFWTGEVRWEGRNFDVAIVEF